MSRIKITPSAVEEIINISNSVNNQGVFRRSLRSIFSIAAIPAPLLNFIACKRLKDISSTMTDMFTDTKVNIYMFRNENPGMIFTFPGAPTTSKPFLFTAGNILTTGVYNIFIFSEFILNSLFQKPMPLEILKGPDGKVELNIHEVTIFINDKAISILEPDELFSVILHELGHNVYANSILISRFKIILAALSTGAVAGMGENIFKRTQQTKYLFLSLMLVLTMYVSMLHRKIEYDADGFSVKAGYGEELKSALNKFKEYFRGGFFSRPGKFNIFGLMLNIINSIFFNLGEFLNWAGFGLHPSIGRRIDRIDKTKTEFNKMEKIDILMNNLIEYSKKIIK